MPISQIGFSAPPASITSASPNCINLAASPIACAPVEHAVTTAWFGPLKPCFIDTCPEIRFIKHEGIKNGETLRGPRSCNVREVSAIVDKPPTPEPIITPVLKKSSSSFGIQPLSATAISAAAMP